MITPAIVNIWGRAWLVWKDVNVAFLRIVIERRELIRSRENEMFDLIIKISPEDKEVYDTLSGHFKNVSIIARKRSGGQWVGLAPLGDTLKYVDEVGIEYFIRPNKAHAGKYDVTYGTIDRDGISRIQPWRTVKLINNNKAGEDRVTINRQQYPLSIFA